MITARETDRRDHTGNDRSRGARDPREVRRAIRFRPRLLQARCLGTPYRRHFATAIEAKRSPCFQPHLPFATDEETRAVSKFSVWEV
jgi:hypothetical protein